MIYRARIVTRLADGLDWGKHCIVNAGVVSSCSVPVVEILELHTKNSRLDRVQAAVHPHHVMLVLSRRPQVSQEPQLFGKARLVRCYQSSVAVRTKVLPGIEAEAANVAQRPRLHTIEVCAMCLCCVFNDMKVMPAAQNF